MPWITVLRTSIALIAVFTLPGWFFLTFGAAWRQWRGLQRWIVAIGLSISFYPVLFYWLRWMFPSWTMGPYKMGVLLAGFAAVVAWRMHRHWRELLTFDGMEWLAIAVLGMTFFTRFWVIRDLPYPAWSDSLHHTLLTQLTAVQGRLPTTLEPYFPVALSDYHLGFYSLTATVEWLAQVPAHTALLWTAQVMSGLCGVGIYLVLDRKVGRLGAVVGMAVAGLLSHQPAFYVNWGRFTQLSSQVVLLIAWMVNWETLALWKNAGPRDRPRLAWHALLAALLSGAVFLLHFLVALFYIPLLFLTVLWEMWQARRYNQTAAFISGTAMAGLLTLVVVAPAAWDAVRGFVMTRVNPVDVPAPTVRAIREQYFEFPWETVPILAARTWLLFVAALSAVFGICRRNGLLLLTVLWMIALYLIGDAYRLGMTWVVLSNLGAVLIMLYLPIGLLVGGAAEELCLLLGLPRRRAATRLMAALALAAGFVASHVRVTEIEPHRFFVTKEDVAAMEWIRDNTEPDALFAVNTYFWLPHHPHGTDAGYWIPYFTGRQMTAAVMLLSGATPEYKSRIVKLSEAEERLEYDTSALLQLGALGVEYAYIGAKGDFSGPGLSAARLSQAQDATLVYQTPRVSIFKIGPPAQGP